VPTYQYACTVQSCGHRFEAVQAFSDDPLTTCPQCEGRLRKVFSAVGVVFKGSGFYRTDSRTDSRKADGSSSNGASGSDSGGSGSGGTSKGESSSSSSSEKSAGKASATAGAGASSS
jgi:putative FmdB family regulatory protein